MDARPLRPTELETAAAALAAAFEEDPFPCWILPDADRRRRALGKVMAIQLRMAMSRGHVYTVDGARGAALWAPPERYKLTIGEQIRLGPRFVRAIGLRTTLRASSGFAEIENRHPAEPHWYLAVLGVSPELQGRGVGRALMAPVLERADAQGLGCYLDTSNPANPAWYERFGFMVREEFDIPRDGPHMWAMWRPPSG